MEAPEGCPAQVYTIMKDVTSTYIFLYYLEILQKAPMTQNLAQAWELEPEKRPTFAASRDSLDLFRTQNPQ